MENREVLKQEVRAEVVAENEIEKAKSAAKGKREILEKFHAEIMPKLKDDFARICMVIKLTELIAEKGIFDSVLSEFRNAYNDFKK